VGTVTSTTRVAACVADVSDVAAGERYGGGACEGDAGGEGDAVDLRGVCVVGGTWWWEEHMNTWGQITGSREYPHGIEGDRGLSMSGGETVY
jgi:hypothetical protein